MNADQLHEITALVNAYTNAQLPQPEPYSPIEAERLELRANEAARGIADLLMRADLPALLGATATAGAA